MVDGRLLGESGLSVASVGFGCMGMSWAYAESSRDDRESERLLNLAADSGVTLFDTAAVYGDGHNERLVGRALAARHDEIVLATKGGLVVDDLRTKTMHREGRPAALLAQVDASLERLGTERIDLYYLHRVDPAVPVEDSWAALATAVEAGKIAHLGISEASLDEVRRAQAIHPVTALQSEVSLWSRDVFSRPGPDAPATSGTAAWASEQNAALIPFAPLGRGFLSGTITSETTFEDRDFRTTNPRFQPEARQRNAHLVTAIRRVAERHGVAPATVAIAWLLQLGDRVIPIPGTRNREHLVDNLAGGELRLTAADIAELDALPEAAGSRY